MLYVLVGSLQFVRLYVFPLESLHAAGQPGPLSAASAFQLGETLLSG